MEQAISRGHEASPQSGLGVDCKLCSCSKKLHGMSVRAQARRISIPLLFSVLGVSSFLFPPRNAMRRGAWKCNAGLGKGGALSLVFIVQATAEEVLRVYFKLRHKPRLRWSDALQQGPAVGCGVDVWI